MSKNDSWREEAWEILLQKIWDERDPGTESVVYNKSDLDPILSKYTKSGQGEIRIFNSYSGKVRALRDRKLVKIPLTRSSWMLIKGPETVIEFKEPMGGDFVVTNPLTDGMKAGIASSMTRNTNPGETTLLAIANHIGIIADFYNLDSSGVLFTGGRQAGGTHLFIGKQDIDTSKAQIEIDGGFEWPYTAVIAEVKSSFKQEAFDINQALIPMLKWQQLLPHKKVYSMILLAETNSKGIEYWAYDFLVDTTKSVLEVRLTKSKKYQINLS
jgi:hypothetical protein